MFMMWVRNKLVPTFEKLHPTKTMVLICDNAAYHHKREVGSSGALKKGDLLELCSKYKIEYLDLPMTNLRHQYIESNETLPISINDNETIRVAFNYDEMKERVSSTKPLNPTTEEMKYSIMAYLKNNQPELMECKVEKYLVDRGHSVLWTPPYSPDLQPIELFWAAGKNHAASMSFAGIKMKQTMKHVRDGWYGNLHEFDANGVPLITEPSYLHQQKQPVDCMKLFQKMVSMGNKKFIPMCEGISGTLGQLTVDTSHIPIRAGVPIDILMSDMARFVEYGNEYDEMNNDDN